MNIKNLPTPAVIMYLDIMEDNIKRYHDLAKKHNKDIWPMTKTHKSKELMKYQIDNGATGLLCGTLDECEAAKEIGIENIMYAYPVGEDSAIDRVIELSKTGNFIIRIDNLEAAKLINEKAKNADVKINYTVIINAGLGRFGIEKETLLDFMKEMKKLDQLVFKGLSTHPGQVYGGQDKDFVKKCSDDERAIIAYAKAELEKIGEKAEYITTGATPTFEDSIADENFTTYHPGNYIFNDAIQISLGVANEENCALRVLASITTNPHDGLYMSDAGAKLLGLDMGAHGNESIVGHGRIVGHPNATIVSLSEEVGKIEAPQGEFKIGERIEIIANHTCVVANLTSYIYGIRNGEVEKVFEVDIRGNSKRF
ncbi:MAG: alanine racemase [Tissierellia bacterium]|nr:alanine racemase [Tissierellia bacterium]